MSARADDFATLLCYYREREGLSCNQLARAAAVDPSYVSRLERAAREPPRRAVVERLIATLCLATPEQDRLLVAAGYSPVSVAALGHWDDTLAAVATVLTDERLAEADRDAFRTVIELLVTRWHSEPPVAPLAATRREG